MKNSYLILLLLPLLISCVTNKTELKSVEPLWFSDSFDYLSPETHIVFKSHEATLEDAEKVISNESKYLISYIKPIKEKEYESNDGSVYLLYSISRKKLKDSMNDKISVIYSEYSSLIEKGDISSNILQKLNYYNDAITIYGTLDPIVKAGKSVDIHLDTSYFDINNLNEIIDFTRDEIVFSVNVTGDINDLIKNDIVNQLNMMNYTTSSNGIVNLDVKVELTSAELNNGFVNKYWDLKIFLTDIYGYSYNSFSRNGRESQVNMNALDQQIIRIISVEVKDALEDLIP